MRERGVTRKRGEREEETQGGTQRGIIVRETEEKEGRGLEGGISRGRETSWNKVRGGE